jgi:hypothetical protein
LSQGRLLIVSPFQPHVTRVTEQTAAIRNQTMVELATHITVGYMRKGGLLENLLQKAGKEIWVLQE